MPTRLFEQQITVTLSDTDAAGVIFFTQVLRHAHDVYEAFMAASGFPLPQLIAQGRFHLPLVHAEADYHFPIGHGERITIRLAVREVGRTSFSLTYAFVDEAGTTRASVRTVHVVVDRGTKKATELPAALREALDHFALH